MASACGSAASKIPRLTLGVLVARHADTISNKQCPKCVSCGQAFHDGEDYMLDVYQLPGNSSVSLLGQTFPKSVFVMVHARCLPTHCIQTLNNLCAFVFAREAGNARNNEQATRDMVFAKFRWALDWVSSHKQYLTKAPVTVHLCSDLYNLCPAGLQSFRLTFALAENDAPIAMPKELISRAQLLSFFTTVVEIDVMYKGPEYIMHALQTAMSRVVPTAGTSVVAFAHIAEQTSASYSSNAVQEQCARVILRIGPSESSAKALVLELVGGTWQKLLSCANDPSSVVHWAELSATTDSIMRALKTTNMQAHRSRPVPISTIVENTSPGKDGVVPANCLFNAQPASAHPLYFFKDTPHAGEKPLVCFQGKHAAPLHPLPVIVADYKLLEQELSVRGGFKEMQLNQLMPLTLSAAKPVAKRD
jgi:hypothetical protein